MQQIWIFQFLEGSACLNEQQIGEVNFKKDRAKAHKYAVNFETSFSGSPAE